MAKPAPPMTAASAPPRQAVSRQGLSDHIYDAILAMLLDRSVLPGAPLRTETLARMLGVSATPVREALARLESTGLVQRAARCGYRAAPLMTNEELAQLIDIRLIIEPANAERACSRADSQFVARLRALVERQKKASTGPNYSGFKGFLEADWSFHELIARHCGNPFLLKTFESFNGYMQRFRQFSEHVVTDASESTHEHEQILSAFEAGDPQRAAEEMRRHLSNLMVRVKASGGGAPAQPAAPAQERKRKR
jgi:DNA-binding GntR family transcriptional regulator